MIAALYVKTGGVYFGIPGVDPWDEPRDARLYSGPHRVVAHPPCERWGRYWYGGPSAKVRKVKGDDGGCFAAALAAVRRFGGVLEHPEGSAAWPWFGLVAPPKSGGWHPAGDFIGWTCCVEQGHYGHRARKASWLYAVDCDLPQLRWGKAEGCIRLDDGFHSSEERRLRAPHSGVELLGHVERAATPIPFRDVLLGMAQDREEGYRAEDTQPESAPREQSDGRGASGKA